LSRTFALLVLLASCKPAVTDGAAGSAGEIASQARKAYDDKDFARSAALYRQAIDRGLKSAQPRHDGAPAPAPAGNRRAAFAFLDEAGASGFHDVETLEKDDDLRTLRSDRRWPGVVATLKANQDRFRTAHGNPDGVRFVTEDVDRFWTVYDQLPGAADPAA